jgi:Asp-tRNA(Asn)/Glu-tRNA(Gln) amidotransferase A subunit family amidase
VCCLASLAGLPAVMVPHGSVDGAPVGLQLVAAPGADRALLTLAREFDESRGRASGREIAPPGTLPP